MSSKKGSYKALCMAARIKNSPLIKELARRAHNLMASFVCNSRILGLKLHICEALHAFLKDHSHLRNN